jgi:transcriptional regulator with XRE-family HTH domain
MTFNLTEKKRNYYKERLSHYLRSYRERNDLTQAETAEKIGYTVDHLKKLESGSEERIANTIEYLMNFSSLDFGSVIDFLVYMENSSRIPQNRGDLYPWETAVLDGFHEQSSEARRDFIGSYCGKKPKSQVPLSEALDLLHAVNKLGLRERNVILFMISKFQEEPLTDEENETLNEGKFKN